MTHDALILCHALISLCMVALPLLLCFNEQFERPGKEGRRRRFEQKQKNRPGRVAFNQRGQLVWVY